MLKKPVESKKKPAKADEAERFEHIYLFYILNLILNLNLNLNEPMLSQNKAFGVRAADKLKPAISIHYIS